MTARDTPHVYVPGPAGACPLCGHFDPLRGLPSSFKDRLLAEAEAKPFIWCFVIPLSVVCLVLAVIFSRTPSHNAAAKPVVLEVHCQRDPP